MTRSFPPPPLDIPFETKLYAKTPQWDDSRCQVCGDGETRDRPFVAVLTYVHKDKRHWVHAGQCHQEHSDRVRAEREQHYREKEKVA